MRFIHFLFSIVTTVAAAMPAFAATLPSNDDASLSNTPDLFSGNDDLSLFDDTSSMLLNEALVGQELVGINDNEDELFFDLPPSFSDELGSGSGSGSESDRGGGVELASTFTSCHSELDNSDSNQQVISKRNDDANICTDSPSKDYLSSSSQSDIGKILDFFGVPSSGQGSSTTITSGLLPKCFYPRFPIHLCCTVEGPIFRQSYIIHEYYWFCHFGTFSFSFSSKMIPFIKNFGKGEEGVSVKRKQIC